MVDELVDLIEDCGERAQQEDRRPRPAKNVGGRKERRGTGASEVVDLIRAGALRVGEELTMRSGGNVHCARVLEDGRFEIGGRIEKSPTEAASIAAQAWL